MPTGRRDRSVAPDRRLLQRLGDGVGRRSPHRRQQRRAAGGPGGEFRRPGRAENAAAAVARRRRPNPTDQYAGDPTG
jgi:hypothetical protein